MSTFIDKWMQHRVYEWNSNLFVRKKQRQENNYTPQEVLDALDFVKSRFWNFCPNTKIVSDETHYVVIQKRIAWKNLCDCDDSVFSREVLISLKEILNICEKILLKDKINFDIIGMQEDSNKSWRIYDDNFLWQRHPFIRKYYIIINILSYFCKCFKLFNKNIKDSSNLMLEFENNSYKLFLVDNVFIQDKEKMVLDKYIYAIKYLWKYLWLKKNQVILSRQIKKTR